MSEHGSSTESTGRSRFSFSAWPKCSLNWMKCGPGPDRSLGHDRQGDARRMLRVVVHGVLSNSPAPVLIEWLAGVRIDIESREIAARDVQPDSVTAPKHQRRRIHFDSEFRRAIAVEHPGRLERFAIAATHDTVTDIQIDACRKIAAGWI